MIIDLPSTTTRAINRRLVRERDEGGVVALGRVMNLLIDSGDHDPEDAIAAANLASREHPCRIIVLSTTSRKRRPNLDAQIRLGGDAGASEVVVLWPAGELREHLDSLVTPLLLPDAPIVVWWPFEVPENPAEHPVGRMGVRRITDTTQCSHPTSTLRALAGAYHDGDTWLDGIVTGVKPHAAADGGTLVQFDERLWVPAREVRESDHYIAVLLNPDSEVYAEVIQSFVDGKPKDVIRDVSIIGDGDNVGTEWRLLDEPATGTRVRYRYTGTAELPEPDEDATATV